MPMKQQDYNNPRMQYGMQQMGNQPMGQPMMNQGMGRPMMANGMMNQSMMNQPMMNRGMMGQPMNQGMGRPMNQGMMNQQGMPQGMRRPMMNNGMMNQSMMNQPMMNQGMARQGMNNNQGNPNNGSGGMVIGMGNYQGEDWNNIQLGDVRDHMSTQDAEERVQQMDQFINQMQGQVDLSVATKGNIEQVQSAISVLCNLLNNPKDWAPTNISSQLLDRLVQKGGTIVKYLNIYSNALANFQQ